MGIKKFDEFVSNSRKATVKDSDTTIVLRESLGFDELDKPYLKGRLVRGLAKDRGVEGPSQLGEVDWGRVAEYTDVLMRTISSEGKHVIPAPHEETEELLSSFWDWLCWPKSLMSKIIETMKDLDIPISGSTSDPKVKKNES